MWVYECYCCCHYYCCHLASLSFSTGAFLFAWAFLSFSLSVCILSRAFSSFSAYMIFPFSSCFHSKYTPTPNSTQILPPSLPPSLLLHTQWLRVPSPGGCFCHDPQQRSTHRPGQPQDNSDAKEDEQLLPPFFQLFFFASQLEEEFFLRGHFGLEASVLVCHGPEGRREGGKKGRREGVTR